jgi:hypothetical protein
MEKAITALASLAMAGGKAAYTGSRLAVTAARRRGSRRPTNRRRRSTVINRFSSQGTFSLVAGAYSGFVDPTLSLVQTTDLIAMYDAYRVNWVEIELSPGYDPAQSGVTNNSILNVWMACDEAAHYTAPTILQTGAFENAKHKVMVAGSTFKYRFYPKPVNVLAAGNYGVEEGFLTLSAGSIGATHQRLYINVITAAASTIPVEYTLKFNVTLRGAY